MKKYLGLTAAIAASIAVTGCTTTNPYGYNNDQYSQNRTQAGNAATGAAVGAVAGGVLGSVVGGVSTTQGALAGAVLGGVLGATRNGRQYYRDTRGYCYYVDQQGRPIYDYNTRC